MHDRDKAPKHDRDKAPSEPSIHMQWVIDEIEYYYATYWTTAHKPTVHTVEGRDKRWWHSRRSANDLAPLGCTTR
jgi:hypothetical protein